MGLTICFSEFQTHNDSSTNKVQLMTVNIIISHLMEIWHCVEKICLQGLVEVTSSERHFQYLTPEVHYIQDNSNCNTMIRYLCTQIFVTFWLFEIVDKFCNLLLGLFQTSNVREMDTFSWASKWINQGKLCSTKLCLRNKPKLFPGIQLWYNFVS